MGICMGMIAMGGDMMMNCRHDMVMGACRIALDACIIITYTWDP